MKSVFDVMDGKVKFKDLDKKKRGRKAGYNHSKETRDKIAEKMKGRIKDDETKGKISKSLLGREKPMETRRKISKSKTHNSVAGDLLQQYSGLSRERDVPTSTHEYLAKVGSDQMDACEWIKENFEAINEGQGPDEVEIRTIRWEADLNAEMKKEEPNLDEVGLVGGMWRPS
jgi:hypothetical protein